VLHIATANDVTENVPARFGFVVSKTVGSAPRRNRVRRQLREIAKANSAAVRGHVVVRALPAATDATWEQLTEDYLRCLRKYTDANR
jgi:ribonuclease P protein component